MKTFWFYHYFPRGLELDLARIPDSTEIVDLLETVGFTKVGVEVSYSDIAADHLRPERYLDKNYRDGMSTFHLLSEHEIEFGCQQLSHDIESGEAEDVIRQYAAMESEVGGSSIVYGWK